MAKKKNACAAISATTPWVHGSVPPCSEEKAQASSASASVMPMESISASGFRPSRSTRTIATTVPMMSMIDVVNE
jgi:hypothetical protein